jgi:DNA/RNA-binding domain of Phe-tRNA-synthetase-like protein
MLFMIEKDIFERFPGLLVGTVLVSGLNNSGRSEKIATLLRSQEEIVRQTFSTDTLSEDPRIRSWRKAYSAFGAKPKKYKSSVESLYRMVLKKTGVPSINPVVDIYNYVSMKYTLPVGGDDLDKVEGSLRLCFAEGDELFLPLNGDEMEVVKPGEVIYRDDAEVLCRRWNWRESDKSKMTPETGCILLVAEALPPVLASELEEAVGELESLIVGFCGGESRTAVLHQNLPLLE